MYAYDGTIKQVNRLIEKLNVVNLEQLSDDESEIEEEEDVILYGRFRR